MKNILCLDLGTELGWALRVIVSQKPKSLSGTKKLRLKESDPYGLIFNKYLSFLKEMINGYKIDTIFYESVNRHAGNLAAHMYGYYKYALLCMAYDHDIETIGVPVSVIKKYATGKGNSNKRATVISMRKRGYEHLNLEDHNEADALALLHYAVLESEEVRQAAKHAIKYS